MGALAPAVPSWIPEDDLLLKNAIEAGASLESLAKGAVRFSRKFTVRELQDRWDSLLYDPVVSEEASSHIIEFECSASSTAGNSNDSNSLFGKRKPESVRSCCDALSKRIRNDPFNSMDLSLLVEPNDSNSIGLEDEPLLGNPISDHFRVQETNVNVMHCSFPQIQESPHILGENQFLVESDSGTEELQESKEFPMHSLLEDNDKENICSWFEGNQIFNSPIVEHGLSIWRTDEDFSASVISADDGLGQTVLNEGDTCAPPDDGIAQIESEIPCEASENTVADTEGYLMEITNTLMNDEPFLLDVDAKDVIDKSFFEGLRSLLASSPNNGDQDQMTESMTIETHDNLAKVSSSGLEESDEVAGSRPMDGPVSCNSNVLNLSSCTLNSEDPEIPCNEDAVFPKQLCLSTASSTGHKEPDNPLSAFVKDYSRGQKASERGPFLIQRDKKDPGQSHGSSQIKISHMIPEVGQLHAEVKCEDYPCVAPRGDGFLSNASAQSNSINVSDGTFPPTLPKENSEENLLGMHTNHSSANSLTGKPALCSDNHDSFPPVNPSGIKQEVDALQTIISPEPVVKPPPLKVAELHIESDDNVPYYSDGEAMILDMDLYPDDEDLCDQEVAKYQHEDRIRAIMRLEQAYRSFMQRDIASHEAFAVLYGRHSNHYYIKKHEILLGRTTEDFIVDIDLGRQGCANTVARQQAIIKMEEDGSFHLKNLGKCSIWIKDNKVAPGQNLGLQSGDVILIRGTPLIFQTNQNCVKQYLKSMAEKKLSSGTPC
ncbi:Leucine-rich repeat family protein [Hibiscus syriacus]|uniref:Leucine-rich repeat family protein n=1 Tax=Hibiscus syriacus TaxID=106335 RepID=A0A6A3CI98_HIBSY|nr:uncharacterized protein LOC120185687 [Hibiscus syriacus]KAE8729040.1 Leucine-rich repeat family protein [Hibiscus syriacus]